jgi:predicted benzoate:H+ symporter BenE
VSEGRERLGETSAETDSDAERWADRLLTAAITVYTIGVFVAFVILVVRVIPASALPALSAFALFLGLLGSLLLAIREAVQPDD